jgi:hypothetical protein
MARVLGRFLIAVLVLIPVGLAAQSAQPVSGESQKLFRSSVDLVTIQASVRDNKGRPMKGLRPVDFEVRDKSGQSFRCARIFGRPSVWRSSST